MLIYFSVLAIINLLSVFFLLIKKLKLIFLAFQKDIQKIFSYILEKGSLNGLLKIKEVNKHHFTKFARH